MAAELCPWDETLLIAAARGEVAKVKDELNMGIDVNSRDLEYQQTPLLWATINDHKEVVQILFEWNADVNALDQQGRTPLLHAASNGHEDLTKILLEAKGISIESRDFSGYTALILAAKYGHDSVVSHLLKAGANPNAQDSEGRTALSWAARRGHESTTRALLDGNATVNLMDELSRTPVLWAARNGHANVVSLLLQQSANIDMKDDYDETPLSWAIRQGHSTVVQILGGGSIQERQTLVSEPTASDRLGSLLQLVKSMNPDYDLSDSKHGQLLLWVIENDHQEDARFIIEQGASLTSRDDNKMTALSLAAEKGQADIVQLLLEKGIDPDTLDGFGRTPISWAAEGGYDEVIKLLMEKNVILNHQDETGMVPLSWAALGGHESTVFLLLNGGADPNLEDENLRTPMSFAAEGGYESIVTLLLEKGATPNEGAEESPLMYAIGEHNIPLFRMLLEKGADPYSDTYGVVEAPPLVLAASHDNEEILKLILAKKTESGEIKQDHIKRALIEASREGSNRAMKLLLNNYPFEDAEGDGILVDALWYAELWGHQEILGLLRHAFDHKGSTMSEADK